MMLDISRLFVILLTFGQTIAQNWSTCSQICGGGHHFKVEQCASDDVNKCPKTYKECNTDACPSRSCPGNKEFYYGTKSSCCSGSKETCSVSLSTTNQDNIFEAKKATAEQWPWATVIVNGLRKVRYCSAVLIHKDWVLTAAQCTEITRAKEDYYVLLGSSSIEKPQYTNQKIAIKTFIPHPNYEFPVNDIALVELQTPATLNDYVKPICLPLGEVVKSDTTCVTAGWGNANPSEIYVGGVLQYVSLRNLPEDACRNGLKPLGVVADTFDSTRNLCFAVLSGKDYECSGDTGGPIMCQRCSSCGWYVAGVSSYGSIKCGSAGIPEVYTKVENYEKWIKSHVRGLGSAKTVSCDSFTSPCTKTCGGGHQYIEKCPENKPGKCEKTYMECNTLECQSLRFCPSTHKFRYGSKSSCCATRKGSCGVSLVKRLPHKIFEAKKTVVGEWPWAAVIVSRMENTRTCSGVLIHKDWVLATGECVQRFGQKEYYVLLGSTRIRKSQKTGQRFDIKSFDIHEEYAYPVNDIGLIQLKKSAVLSDSVQPICLPNGEEVEPDTICVSAGWGNANLDASPSGGILRHVSHRHLPEDACLSSLKHFTSFVNKYDSKVNMCFGISSGKDFQCSGDTGGPIMCQKKSTCQWFVAGMASYGPNRCGKAGLPDVYVKVKGYEAWIRQKISGLPSPSKAPGLLDLSRR